MSKKNKTKEIQRLAALHAKVCESSASMEREYQRACGLLFEWVSGTISLQEDFSEVFDAKYREWGQEPEEFLETLWGDVDSLVEDRSKVTDAVRSGMTKFEFMKQGAAVGLRSVQDFGSMNHER